MHKNKKVPLSEMFGYATNVRSMSQGRASFSMEFSKYSEVPNNIADDKNRILKMKHIIDQLNCRTLSCLLIILREIAHSIMSVVILLQTNVPK